MTRKTDITRSDEVSAPGAIDRFLRDATRLAPAGGGPRLVFALDATMSRQPTWDLASELQAEMFDALAGIGELQIQLVYYRGLGECRASRWVRDAAALRDLMSRIACRGGHTQIGRVLRHARTEAGRSPLGVLVFVGDAVEESVDDLCAVAGELALLGVRAFMFQEGGDPRVEQAFREIARLTGGAYARFDSSAPQRLAALLRAAAIFAGQGIEGLTRLAARDSEARALLAFMSGRSE
jgi:hypothetical protein